MENIIRGILNKINEIEKKLAGLRDERSIITSKISALEAEKTDLQTQIDTLRLKWRPDVNEWSENEFPWAAQVNSLLKEKWGFKEFRDKQLGAINATLSKKDVLVLMPTGGGKSLIYQLPALVTGGITLVISPLIALIENQIYGLKKINVEAASLNGSTHRDEKKRIYKEMTNKSTNLRLVYVTPEWVAKSKIFMNYLQKCNEAKLLKRIVIDEVHCCSTWGHDFRPDYQYLGLLKGMFSKIPIIGLTATATMDILLDVQNTLSLKEPLIFSTPYNRPNLLYRVVDKTVDKKYDCDQLIQLLNGGKQSSIVYVATVNECIEVAKSLRQKGLRVRPYHATVDPKQKTEFHEQWLNNEIDIIVATTAFGMGIDKPDVRYVVHYSVPKSMESFYQESGRAGRDFQSAECILMFSLGDYLKMFSQATSLKDEKKARFILKYCLAKDKCRRGLISEHFEETDSTILCKKMCDICKFPFSLRQYDCRIDLQTIEMILKSAQAKDIKMTLKKLIDAWVVQHKNVDLIEKIIGHLILTEYLKIDKGYTMYTTIAYICRSAKEIPRYGIFMLIDDRPKSKPTKTSNDDGENSNPKKKARLNIVDSDSDD